MYDGLITHAQAEQILMRYSGEAVWTRYLFPVLGSILLGLGIILFFASNWQAIPIWGKLGLIFGSLVVCHVLAYYYRYRSKQPWLGTGLFVLAGILFGSAIFLIAQIYNINSYFPNGILFWGLGVLLMAWFSGETPLVLLALLLLNGWMISDLGESGPNSPWLQYLILFGAMFPLVYKNRNPIGAFLTLFFLVITFASTPALETGAPNWVMLLIFLGSALAMRGFDPEELFRPLYQFFGMILVMGPLYLLSFHDFVQDYYHYRYSSAPTGDFLSFAVVTIPLVILVALVTFHPRFRDQYRPIRFIPLLLGALVLLAAWLSPTNALFGPSMDWLIPLLFNLILFTLVITLIILGNRIQHRPMLNLGLVFFYLQVIARYFDYAYAYMDRSLFFILGGLLLLALGWLLNRQQSKLVKKWGEADE
ncbi:MAG: DUF2157 domain-containing protein [Solirubrobacterales bacterium]